MNNNIAKAFVAAKREFAPALKTATNPHFKSKYADLAGCLEAVNDALLNHGIALYQETSEDGVGVTVETVFLHESGETLRGGKLHVPASKQDPQGYGSALTYARRYSVMAACGISSEDDDGNAASKRTAPAKNHLDTFKKEPAPAMTDPFKLMLPGKDEPFSTHATAAEWATAFINLLNQIENSSKYTPRERMTKMRELREANESLLVLLDVVAKAKAMNDYQLRLKRLGASLADDEK